MNRALFLLCCLGASLDETDLVSLQKESPRTVRKIDKREPLSVDDIKKMSQAGLSDTVIIAQIEATETAFSLKTADTVYLRDSGVSQKVIDTMIKMGQRASQ